ncbi:hypothetical protein [Amycolatopsis sp. NPDC050768]|uniref:hypothetical protein n=1 Tax=Amycolatopsis sp. NPDC050768 TaxID=3154839 RepID=UPI0033D9F09A
MPENAYPPPSFRPKVPADPAYDHWLTYRVERRILVVTRTVTTVTRLLDILSLLEDDHRVQVVFTFDDRRRAVFGAGLAEFLAGLEALVLPWDQALATTFDLAIAASENDDLAELKCPVLLVPHGIGHQKYYPRTKTISGLNPERLHGDRLRIGLSHGNQLSHVPEHRRRAVVIGDPCHDRMLASVHRVPHFRRVLGAADRTHVVLASTWGPQSLIGSDPQLPHRFLAELPLDEYRVSLVLHPGVWSAHSALQVRAVLASARRSGLAVIPPQRGWQATVLSAGCVVSDCGSMPLYATAAGVPVVMASPVADTVVAGSPLADLVARAPRLDERPLADQLAAAITNGPIDGPAAEAVEYPGKCAELLRALLYDLLDLPEPARPAAFPPVDDPTPEFQTPAALRVSVQADGADLVVRRFPAAVPQLGGPLPGQHVVAHAELATLAELEGAAVVHHELGRDFAGWAADTARRRPNARLFAETAPGLCRVWTDGVTTDLRTTADVDPLLLASAAQWRTVRRLPLTDLRVRVGDRTI